MLDKLPTNTLLILWNNIHKQKGLIGMGCYYSPSHNMYCTLGATLSRGRLGQLRDEIDVGMADRLGLLKIFDDSGSFRILDWIVDVNDSFEGTPAERRIYILKLFGAELMKRDSLKLEKEELMKVMALL